MPSAHLISTNMVMVFTVGIEDEDDAFSGQAEYMPRSRRGESTERGNRKVHNIHRQTIAFPCEASTTGRSSLGRMGECMERLPGLGDALMPNDARHTGPNLLAPGGS